MRTGAFAQPLLQPVTLFCVGIAFEDATFVSGLNARFEVCHAYPTQDQPDHERAPVSITAHPVGDSSDSDDDPSPGAIVSGATQPGDWHVYTAGKKSRGRRVAAAARRGSGGGGGGALVSMRTQSAWAGRRGGVGGAAWEGRCWVQRCGPVARGVRSTLLHRFSPLPPPHYLPYPHWGLVFNGDQSALYVDGVREGDSASSAAGLASAAGGGTNVGTGALDGLTIGADHRNDFPLGSMIEGTVPGALAELVVFGSVLPAADRARIERKLMVRNDARACKG